MITFITHVQVMPENVAAFEALLTHVRDMTRKHEGGVPYYDFGRSVDEPGTYAVIEVYRDAAAHTAHMKTDWVAQSIPESRRLVDGKFNIKQYVGPGIEPAVRQMQES
jgi:quinol monooxygenase YgiN